MHKPVATINSVHFPLAQMVDLLPEGGWYALIAIGLAVPFIALMIANATDRLNGWKASAVAMFYVVSLPLAGLVMLAHTENPVSVCSFFILMPIGAILGVAVLLTGVKDANP